MSMIATISLLAVAPLIEVADLCFVNSLGDTKVLLAMCEWAIII
jgi:hypothetical protein